MAAIFLFIVVFPLFRQVVERLGEPQQVSIFIEMKVTLGTLVLLCAYWIRYRWIAIQAPFRSALIGHFLQFSSRVSFFFGGALFSALFFRHIPALEVLPPISEGLIKSLLVAWMLFGLFCYSLELDRLGKAIEGNRAN
ncbi:hypothetical protein AB4Z10_13305 [Bosea sp. RAF48]|uniref:hypothetical protein n=1 Tax=Bosea sp. RAF48 TaxID=3237480 RepID=UPI003F93869B